MMCHLPASQKEFFEKTPGNLELRAKFYDDEEFTETSLDSVFNLRPVYAK